MSKYKFTPLERYVIWETHGRVCYWDKEPIDFRHMTVDHVIPELYSDKPEELEKIKKQYALEDDFEINDYCNWVPCHGNCNSRKSITVYKASEIFLGVFHDVGKMGLKAAKLELRLRKKNMVDEVLAKLEIEIDKDPIVQIRLVEQMEERKLPEGVKVIKPKGWYLENFDPSNGEAWVTNGSYRGVVPTSAQDQNAFVCPHCRNLGPWNGVMCMTCGQKNCD